MERLVVGTRGSKLALWQARFVKEELETLVPALRIEIQVVSTEGDSRHDLAPGAFAREGIFTAELDRALLDHNIDVAVHSLKDMPTRMAKGLVLAAVTERAAVSDTFILHRRHFQTLLHHFPPAEGPVHLSFRPEDLPRILPHLVIGTSSLRRQAFLRRLWPSFSFAPLRGNLDTRLRKLEEGEVDALVVATAGLHRLLIPAHGHLFFTLDFPEYLPAAGQGALGIATRASDPARELAGLLNHKPTFMAVMAERVAMSRLGAGCRVPAGFLGIVDGITLKLRGAVASSDGRTYLSAEVEGEDVDFEDLGWRLAEELKEQGAEELLREARG
jgi:hydroxymethylbilane synthase